MATLNALNKAPILNQSDEPLGVGSFSVTSSDAMVAQAFIADGQWLAKGISAGTATLTATRLVDSATATLAVEVIAASPFTIHLGAESPA